MNGACNVKFFGPGPWGPGEGSKDQISFDLNYKVNFKYFFIPNFVGVLTNEIYKTYQMGFSFCLLGHAPGLEFWGAGGAQGVIFFKHGHVVYQIDGDDEQNRMQVKFSSKGHTGDLGVRSNGHISLNFGYHVNFKIFIPNFVCFLTNERYKTYQKGFLFCRLGHAPGV